MIGTEADRALSGDQKFSREIIWQNVSSMRLNWTKLIEVLLIDIWEVHIAHALNTGRA